MTSLTAEINKKGELVRAFWQVQKSHKKWVTKRAKSLGISSSSVVRGLIDQAME